MTCQYYNKGKQCAQQPERREIDHSRVEYYCLSDGRSPTCVHRALYSIQIQTTSQSSQSNDPSRQRPLPSLKSLDSPGFTEMH